MTNYSKKRNRSWNNDRDTKRRKTDTGYSGGENDFTIGEEIEDDAPKNEPPKGFLTNTTFDSLELDRKLKNNLKKQGFKNLTPIQEKTINGLMKGKDVLGAAKTGSGKTLAFLVPAVEKILKEGKHEDRGYPRSLVLSPTRELAIQTFKVVLPLVKGTGLRAVLLIGGTSRHVDRKKLFTSADIVIGTPGRILDHLQDDNPALVLDSLQTLVFDEADRLLDVGFEKELHQIISFAPEERQSMLFSATLVTKKIQNLVSKAVKPDAENVSVSSSVATVETLTQEYFLAETKERFIKLFSLLNYFKSKKVIVFFNTINSVILATEVLGLLGLNNLISIHGRLTQRQRTNNFFNFTKAKKQVLLSTDVCARGLDIPAVDLIVQFDPAGEPEEYIHRVGRTARAGTSGRAILFLTPSEKSYLNVLKNHKVKAEPFDHSQLEKGSSSPSVQDVQELVSRNRLGKLAESAISSYLSSYSTNAHRGGFKVHNLQLEDLALSFGVNNADEAVQKFSHKLNKRGRSGFSRGNRRGRGGGNMRRRGKALW